MSEQAEAGVRKKRSEKWGTGIGAALSVFGILSAVEGTGLSWVGTVGALVLGIGIAREWRN